MASPHFAAGLLRQLHMLGLCHKTAAPKGHGTRRSRALGDGHQQGKADNSAQREQVKARPIATCGRQGTRPQEPSGLYHLKRIVAYRREY